MRRETTYEIPTGLMGKETILQIHQKSGNPLASILGVVLIKEVIKMSIIFLSNFIMENLKSFSMLWKLHVGLTISTKYIKWMDTQNYD